ncbi:MAG: hypothetical protein GF418_17195 [Chitinivibrionales bacterium]|nr:hypothetical protein [Chitinivibrionales bacterium]MBD3397356.1 hypothetical protein [Chitinivibrionales bacterium]
MGSDGDPDVVGANWSSPDPFELWENRTDPATSAMHAAPAGPSPHLSRPALILLSRFNLTHTGTCFTINGRLLNTDGPVHAAPPIVLIEPQ